MGTTSRILDSPILYQWDLNENSTRYDYPRGRPEDDVLQIQFSILAFINGLVAIATFILILAILKSKKLRSNAFNLYLLFMAIPDFIGSFLCLLTCALSAPGSDFYSETMCGFQAFYLVFAFCGNAWTNLVIVYQVNKLLVYSQHRRRYFPPTRQQVFCHVAVVYIYALIWASIVTFPFQGMPIQSKLYYGFACFPMEQDMASTWFFYLAFLPGILLIPFLYTLLITGRIVYKKMLPKEGKSRNLSIFLMRLILLYFVGWLPFLILAFVGNFTPLGPWGFWVGAMASHFQGFISSLVVYYTSDSIRREMKKILCCACRQEEEEEVDNPLEEKEDEDLTEEMSTFSSFFRVIVQTRTRRSSAPAGSSIIMALGGEAMSQNVGKSNATGHQVITIMNTHPEGISEEEPRHDDDDSDVMHQQDSEKADEEMFSA